MSRPVVVILTAGALLLAATVTLAVVLSRPGTGPGATVAVIGDSYSSGTVEGGLGATNWTAVLATQRAWQLTDTAIPGTGYLRARPYAGPYGTAQLDQVVALDPDVVIVQGSLNDGELPAAQVGTAAAALFAAVRDRAPAAQLVVIGPAWPGDSPPPALLAVRDATAGAATAAGAVWIDPIAEQWFAGPDRAGLIGSDGLHPTDAGHRLMAERTADDLVRLGR